jgi:hypothetical protein
MSWVDRAFYSNIKENSEIPRDVKASILATADSLKQGFKLRDNQAVEGFGLDLSNEDHPVLTVPEDLTRILADPVLRLWIVAASNLPNVTIQRSAFETPIPVRRSPEDITMWHSFFNYLTNPEIELGNWNFPMNKPVNVGRSMAKHLIWLYINRDNQEREQFLPNHLYVNNVGRGRVKRFNTELEKLGGVQSFATRYPGMLTLIATLNKHFIKKFIAREDSITAEELQIPFGDLISKVVKKKQKTRKEKGKAPVTTTQIIKLTKPSEKVELILLTEKDLFRKLDGPWTELDRITALCKNGVAVDEALDIRARYAEAYNETFTTNEKLNGFLAHRRRNIRAILGLREKERITIPNGFLQDYLREAATDREVEDRAKKLSSFLPQAYKSTVFSDDASVSSFSLTYRNLSFDEGRTYVDTAPEDWRPLLIELTDLVGYVPAAPVRRQRHEDHGENHDYRDFM